MPFFFQINANFRDLIEIVKDNVQIGVFVDDAAGLEAFGFLEELAELSFRDSNHVSFFHLVCPGLNRFNDSRIEINQRNQLDFSSSLFFE